MPSPNDPPRRPPGLDRGALRSAVVVVCAMRLAVWLVVLFAQATSEPRRNPNTLNLGRPELLDGLSQPWAALFGVWGNWDGVWFLGIAEHGYGWRDGDAAFFPVQPLLMRVVGTVTGGPLVAAFLIGVVASVASAYLLFRLTERELGRAAAPRAMLYLAVAPMSLFLVAAYSEALFLAFSLAALWAARRGHFLAASAWGGLAAATRVGGMLLLIPITMFWIERCGGWRAAIRPAAARLALVPAGLAAYGAFLWAKFGDPLAFANVQDIWRRRLVTPFQGVWDAGHAALDGVRQLASGGVDPVYWTRSRSDPIRVAALNLELAVVLVLLAAGVVLVARHLHPAYAWYSGVLLLLPLATPGTALPLLSLPRFGLVVAPLYIALAAWTLPRPGRHTGVLVVSSLLLGLFATQWATWQWVS